MAYPQSNFKIHVLAKTPELITSTFGTRNGVSHKGIDLIGAGSSVCDVLAFAAGVVYAAGFDAQRGYYATITHTGGYRTIYMHMKKDTLAVKKGDTLKAGQKIGFMGNTGDSNGAHLHFQLELNGTAIDPLPFLEGKKSITSYVVTPERIKEAQEALKAFQAAGIIDDAEYWISRMDKVTKEIKYFPALLAKLGKIVKG